MPNQEPLEETIQKYLSEGRRTSAFQAAFSEVVRSKGANQNLASFAFTGAWATGFVEEAFALLPYLRPQLGNAEFLPNLADMMVTCGHAKTVRDMGLFDLFFQDPWRFQTLLLTLLNASMEFSNLEPHIDQHDPMIEFLSKHLVSIQNQRMTSIGLQLIAKVHGNGTINDIERLYFGSTGRQSDDVPFQTAMLRTNFWESAIDSTFLTSLDRTQIFPETNDIPRLGIGVSQLKTDDTVNADGEYLNLDAARLQEGVRRTVGTIKKLSMSNLQAQKKFAYLASLPLRPVCVVSTGRVGTQALHQLLSHSKDSTSFHYLSQHWESAELNAFFYSMFFEESNERLLETYLSRFIDDRFAELAYCHRNERVPIIVNHLDSVLAVFYLALFPETRIIHAHRNPLNTLQSLAFKQQFGYRQIRNLNFEVHTGSRYFHYRRNRELTILQECAWYMYATEIFAHALKANVPTSQYMDLHMEDLFAQSHEGFAGLTDFLDDSSLDLAIFTEVFAKPINQKDHYKLDGSPEEIAGSGDILDQTFRQLRQTGRI